MTDKYEEVDTGIEAELGGTGAEFKDRIMAEVGEGATFDRAPVSGGARVVPRNRFESTLNNAGMPLSFDDDIGNAILNQ